MYINLLYLAYNRGMTMNCYASVLQTVSYIYELYVAK